MTKAQIVGWAHSPFGKSELEDTEQLMASVATPAMEHAGIDMNDLDGIFVGVMNNGFSKQDFQGALVAMGNEKLAQSCRRPGSRMPARPVRRRSTAPWISSNRAVVASPLWSVAEKMTALPTSEVGDVLLGASYRKEEANVEGGFAGLFGRIAQAYFQRYGDHSEELAMIAAKNHANGALNPYAHMRKDFGFDFCNTVSEKNPYVAGPLRRTDCSLISDGAAAIVLADEETAASLKRAIGFRGRRHVNDILALSRRDVLAFEGARRAWAGTLSDAGLGINDLSFVETHDCFTIAEMIEYEAMGLAKPGEGHRVIREGISAKGGKLPVNPSGGLKSKGHPIGATGVSMHVMAAMQLAGEAGDIQVPNAELAGVFNMGGAAVSNYVSIMERVK